MNPMKVNNLPLFSRIFLSTVLTLTLTLTAIFPAQAESEDPIGNTAAISISYLNPTPTGDGERSKTVGMGENALVGTLAPEGLNLFTYIDAIAQFQALHSSTYTYEEHTMTITGLDMVQQTVSFKIESDPQYFSLKLGDEIQVDLDKDSIKDIKVKFSNLVVNRIEMTLKSLLTKTGTPATPTTTKSCDYTFTRNLYLGMSGADVKELQKCLNSIGYTVTTSGAGSIGNETMYYGYATRAAVMKLQSVNGISPVGYVGALTRTVLNK